MTLKYPEDTAEKLLDRLGVYRRNLTEDHDGQMELAKLAEFEQHFSRVMPLPNLQQLRELLEVSFFASLLTEEGELCILHDRIYLSRAQLRHKLVDTAILLT